MTVRITPATTSRSLYLPFFLGDILLLCAGWLIYQQAHRPMLFYELVGFALCVAAAATLGVWPFILSQRAAAKLAETSALADTLAQIQNLQQIADRIQTATGQWQTVQEHSAATVNAAREIADRMTAEAEQFRVFFEKANEAEKNHLRLEVEKLRRAEGDWLQIVIRVLDHVYALYSAGLHSGQPHLIEQLGGFQNACRDAVRRIGLVPLVAPAGTPFDARLHQLPDPDAQPVAGAAIAETLATGYTFQGQLLRRPVVSLLSSEAAAAATGSQQDASAAPGSAQELMPR